MNTNEYHAIDWDSENPHYGVCRFCNKEFGDHEKACPHHPHTDNLVYLQLREPWTETP